jgi:hypothetical protein
MSAQLARGGVARRRRLQGARTFAPLRFATFRLQICFTQELS